jgi:hypothetical protein
MSIPTNIVVTRASTGLMVVTWDEGEYPATYYEIWLSIDGGNYAKVGDVFAGIKTFNDVFHLGETFSYKIKGKDLNESNIIRSKFDYDNYTIELFTASNGENYHVEFQRGKVMFASKTGKLMWSIDRGYTFTEVDFEYADLIVYSHIFDNGNVWFATENNKMFLGKNALTTITEKFVKNPDGTDFIFHTPINALYPGIYFLELIHHEPIYLNGNEMAFLAAYPGYQGIYQVKGAAPINIYGTLDQGETIKCIYKHGYNVTRDDGTAAGSMDTGNQLGDPTNSRTSSFHCHQVVWDNYEQCLYATFGEDTGAWWIKLVYDNISDWVVTTAVNKSVGKWMKCCGIYISDTHFIICSDRNSYNGVYKCLKTDLTDTSKHENIYSFNMNLAPAIVYNNIIFCGHLNDELGCTISLDGGVTWNSYNSFPPILSTKRFMKMGYPNDLGEFLVSPYDFKTESCMGQLSYLIKFK